MSGLSFGQGFSLVAGNTSGGGAPTGAAGGDLGGTYPDPIVVSVSDVASGIIKPANGGTGVANVGNATFPAGNFTVARTDVGQTFIGNNTFGNITVTTVNGLGITTSTGNLAIANGKTVTVNNSLALSGTDGTTQTFPNGNITVARIDAAQTFTGNQTFSNLLIAPQGSTAQFTFANTGPGNEGLASPGNNAVYIVSNGAPAALFTAAEIAVSSAADIAFTTNSTLASNSVRDTFITRRAAANLNLGKSDGAIPIAQTLSVQSVVTGTNNTAGQDFTVRLSGSTGNATGGRLLVTATPPGSTGNTTNAFTTVAIIDTTGLLTTASPILHATSGNLTNNSGAQIATITNGPTSGNPTKWIPINDNGTIRNIPAW